MAKKRLQWLNEVLYFISSSVAAAVSMLSMAGIPLTAGFMGKFSIFAQAIQYPKMGTFMVLIAVLGSAISIAYYLRLIMMMFFPKESSFKTSERVPLTYNIVAVFIIFALVALGVFPDLFARQFAV